MSETEGTGGAGYLMAALIGVVVGAAVSLLLAPRSGKETRGWLADGTRKVKARSTALLQQGMHAVHLGAQEPRDGENTGSGA